MAETARPKKETVEYFDEPAVLAEKIARLTEWVRGSKHFIAFTGAGISTSAGIPDFRSGMDTVLTTGPGVWELRAHSTGRPSTAKTVSTLQAIPTPTHMSLVALQQARILKFLVSQNTDGLHRRSGFPASHLSELHGNSNLEICARCHKEYLRDFRTRTAKAVHDHVTGRKCICGGNLHDSIINFGEVTPRPCELPRFSSVESLSAFCSIGQNLPEKALTDGFRNGEKADLCLVLGSSLTVTPAADIPAEVGSRRSGKLVIVNLQKTPLDRKADLVIHATCDTVMRGLMDALSMPIPTFKLVRNVKVVTEPKADKFAVTVQGVDQFGTPYSLFRSVQIAFPGSRLKPSIVTTEPFTKSVSHDASIRTVRVTCEFMGHYGEPKLAIEQPIGSPVIPHESAYRLSYDPLARLWETHLCEPEGSEAADSKEVDSVAGAIMEMKFD